MKLTKIKLPLNIKKPVLALGGHTKNTICFAEGNLAVLSQMHSDLSSPEDHFNFKKDVKRFLRRNPRLIAHDLHPEYQSTKYANQLSAISYQLSAIQHHHAHIASCMAENGIRNKKVIGVAFDGTGLGSDNRLWGAEFLICDYKNFKRAAHLKEIPLLGGQKAILKPYRLIWVWLYLIYRERLPKLKINFIKGIDKQERLVFKKMLSSGFNSPLSSSMGRLFDAASSLILNKHTTKFEAELPMELEKLAFSYQASAIGYRPLTKSYQFKISKNKAVYIIDPSEIFKQIITDLIKEEPKEKIAYRFHLTIADMVCKTSKLLRKSFSINEVVLSGGVFQNKLLLSLSLGLLYKGGFRVFAHQYLSASDACISLGQAVVANSNN